MNAGRLLTAEPAVALALERRLAGREARTA